jgi:polysaccharide biosynthesis/export protein
LIVRESLVSIFVGLSLLSGAAHAAANEKACAAPQALSDDEYRLGIGDRIRMLIYNERDLSGEFLVNSAGNIAMPMIGDVKAIGQTTSEVERAARDRFADGYLRDPRVSIEMITFRPFFIMGEIKAPAQYPYSSGLTVMNAIATAGGYTPRAERRVVNIRMPGAEDETSCRLTPDLRVVPGETIRVGERIF